MQQFRVHIRRKPGQRMILNALLAMTTGILALLWPNFLYYIVGGYLVAFGLILFFFRVSNFLTALTAIAATLVFLFPELIPLTFAFFLGLLGLTLLLSFNLIPLGAITLIFAILIAVNPGSVAYMIGIFLLLYGFTHLINLFQDARG